MRFLFLFLSVAFMGRCMAQDSLFTPVERLSRAVMWSGVAHSDAASFTVLRHEHTKEDALRMVHYNTQTCAVLNEHVHSLWDWFGAGAELKGWLRLKHSWIIFVCTEHNEVVWQAATLSADGAVRGIPSVIYNERATQHNVRFRWNITPDSSHFLFYSAAEKMKEENELYTLTVFDEAMEEQWSKDLRLPQKPGTAEITELFPDDSTGVYFVSTSIERKNDFQFSTMEYGKYVVYYYRYAENRLKEYEVTLNEKQVVNMRGVMRRNGALVLGGYFSNRSDERVAGTFLFEIKPNGGAIQTASYAPFPDDLLEQFADGKRFRKKGGILNFYLDHVFLRPDGGVVLIGEQFLRIEQYMNDVSSGRQTVEYTYHYDDVVITHMDATGAMKWNVRIPKQQYAYSNDPSCSYGVWYTSEAMHLFFNDEADNCLNKTRDIDWIARAWFNARLGITAHVEVCNDGTSSREVWVDNAQAQLLFQPNTSSETSSLFPVASYRDAREVRYLPLKLLNP